MGNKSRTSGKGKITDIWDYTVSEWRSWFHGFGDAKLNATLAFAIACVLIVIVGNVILLIAINFWLSIFPQDIDSNNSQIAVQVIVCVLLVMCFIFVGIIYVAIYGFRPLWRALVDTNRVHGPLFRLFLLFASGATNALTGVLAVFSMSHTPEFIQAVLLSVIPFCAQIWTYVLVPEERKRRYISLTLIASLLLCVAGVLLSSMSSFIGNSETQRVAPWDWTLIYLASAVVFGLWCVVQRLYLDAIMFRVDNNNNSNNNNNNNIITREEETERETYMISGEEENINAPAREGEEGGNIIGFSENKISSSMRKPYETDISFTEEETSLSEPLLMGQRQFGKQNEDDFAAKTVLLLVGILFQTLVSFACVPCDAIPWFGAANNITEAWNGFVASCNFIFASWVNIRYGMLHTLGFFMSFVGCAYLNERSPTLASVVLQLAGPVTSLILIIVPKWDVYGEHGNVGHKVGGVILLALAGLLYHVWDLTSLQNMLELQEENHNNHHNINNNHNNNNNNNNNKEDEREEGKYGNEETAIGDVSKSVV